MNHKEKGKEVLAKMMLAAIPQLAEYIHLVTFNATKDGVVFGKSSEIPGPIKKNVAAFLEDFRDKNMEASN